METVSQVSYIETLSISQAQAVIQFIEKKDQDKRYIKKLETNFFVKS